MPAPVFIGGTLRATSEVLERRPSRSRSHAGLVTFAHELTNRQGEIACKFLRAALLRRRTA